MRDDIHNKAAISPALRSLLKLALRPADQENPARLRDLAIKPLLAELRANISARVVQELGQEQAQPALFGRGDLASVGGSRMQVDVLHNLACNADQSVGEAVQDAARSHSDSMCREVEATLISAGAGRNEVRAGMEAFQSALDAATPAAVEALLQGGMPDVTKHTVSLSEKLPLGSHAATAMQ